MMTKQRLGDAADMLNMKFNFDKNVEFLGHKEEAARELYNWCRDQERSAGKTMEQFHAEQAAWSQSTFGSDADRGPIGPMKHLAREVLTEMLGIPREDVTAILQKAKHGDGLSDVVEHADLQFLVFDSSRRAGFTFKDLLEACFKKLEVNKARQWGPKTGDEPVEHIKAAAGVAEPAQPNASRSPEEGRVGADPPA